MANIPLYVVTTTRLDAGTLHLEVGFGWPELHATQAVSEALYIRWAVSTQRQSESTLAL